MLSGIQRLDVAVPGSVPHPAGKAPPPLAVIPAALRGVLIVIGGVIVGITTIRAHVFAAPIGWLLLLGSGFLLLAGPVGAELGIIIKDSAVALLFAGLAWAGASLSFQLKPTPLAAPEVAPN